VGLADTSGIIERTNSFTARCPEEQQELPGQFFNGVAGKMTRRRAQGFSLVSSLREKPLLLS
jgi:hypothetical protein